MNNTFGIDRFCDELRALGYTPEELGGSRLSFTYTIIAGRFAGKTVTVGIDVPADFNVTCPTGPHISPPLINNNPSGRGNDRAAPSPFGPEWQYLSRPFGEQQAGWARTSREVKAYIRHIKRILEGL